MTAFLLLFSLMGVVAGFTSARFYKIMDFAEWRSNTLYASWGSDFSSFFFLNFEHFF